MQHLDLTGGLLSQALGSPFAAGTQLAWDGLLPEKVGLFHFSRIRDSLEVLLLVRQEDLMKVIQKKKKKALCPNQTQTNKPMTSPAITAIGQQFPADRFGLLIQRLPVLQLAWDCVLLKLLLKLL